MSTMTNTLRMFAEAVQKLAFSMPAPNSFTPQFVDLASEAIHQANLLEANLTRQPEVSEEVTPEILAAAVCARNKEYTRAQNAGEPRNEGRELRAALTAVWHNRPAREKVEPVASDARFEALARKIGFDGIEALPGYPVAYCRETCDVDRMIENGCLLKDFDNYIGYTAPPAERGQEKAEPVACDACHGVKYIQRVRGNEMCWKCNGTGVAPVATAARVRVPDYVANIGRLIAAQDNMGTDQPMFIVQQKRESVGHSDYDHARIAWVHEDGGAADESEHALLEDSYHDEGTEPQGWRRLAVCEHWEFVTACFTEQGCKDYLARNGHNLREPRIYAEGSFRNEEFRQLRNFLLLLSATPEASRHEESK